MKPVDISSLAEPTLDLDEDDATTEKTTPTLYTLWVPTWSFNSIWGWSFTGVKDIKDLSLYEAKLQRRYWLEDVISRRAPKVDLLVPYLKIQNQTTGEEIDINVL